MRIRGTERDLSDEEESMITRRALLVVAMGVMVGAPGGAPAADYPVRPIEIVVP